MSQRPSSLARLSLARLSLVALLVPLAGFSACERQFVQTCTPVTSPSDPVALTLPPIQQLRREHVRLRFESLELVDIPVEVDLPDRQCTFVTTPDQDRQDRTWRFPAEGVEVPYPDVPGDHTLHTTELLFEDLGAEPSAFTVHAGRDESDQYTGSVRAPHASGEPLSVLVTGSLAPPVQSKVLALGDAADLVFLLGDLRRNGVDASSWSQLAHDVHAAQPDALVHTAYGDLEDLDADTAAVWLRWFSGQGRAGSGETYYAIDLAGVRFIVLDTQDDRLDAGGSQRNWLDAELRDVVNADRLREAVVLMHRGPYDLAEQVPADGLRDNLVGALKDTGVVRVVLSGHGHGYERFDVDGVLYLDEGGGGGELGNIDHRVDADPDGAALRVFSSNTHGATRLDFAEDGALTITRLDVTGAEVDSVSLPAP